jgi:hypothetical protein
MCIYVVWSFCCFHRYPKCFSHHRCVRLTRKHPTFFCFSFYCCGENSLWYLQKLLQYMQWVIVELTPFIILYSPSPIPGIVSTDLIFAFTYTSSQFLHYIHSPKYFYLIHTPFHCYQCPYRTCSAILFSDFVKNKK